MWGCHFTPNVGVIAHGKLAAARTSHQRHGPIQADDLDTREMAEVTKSHLHTLLLRSG